MKELVVEKENLKHNLKIINEIISKDKKKENKKNRSWNSRHRQAVGKDISDYTCAICWI